jgi:hypothetical protein
VQKEPLTPEEFSQRILCEVPVDDVCDVIFNDPKTPFDSLVNLLADAYARDEFIPTPISKTCKTCQFQASADDFAAGLESGRHFCWSRQLNLPPEELDKPTILDIWRASSDKLIAAGKLNLTSVTAEDFIPKSSRSAAGPGLSTAARQWLQVSKIVNGDNSVFLDREGLAGEMAGWTFPLHFIDFETATPAIPFNQGRRPYEEIAFQFSHHIVGADGRVAHVGQYLNTGIGEFPNFGFIRALKAELDRDDGTIFRYADHENTYLRVIRRQLQESSEPDRDELSAFIDSITSWSDGAGPRAMVDLLKLVLRYYYDPQMGGSNSIKKVLPAILRSSGYLQQKYSGSAYGTEIPSLNYREGKSWVERDSSGIIRDPYELLEKLFASDEFESVSESELKDGGAAMISYAQLQYEDMPESNREEIRNALLRYCELDTLAMVMIYEGWREMLRAES